LGYDEIKTEMLDRQETIRSRTVQGIEQEVWGILLAYNLVRLEMARTAEDLGVEPTRISFVTSLRIICDTWAWCAIASPARCQRASKPCANSSRGSSASPADITPLSACREDQDEQLRQKAPGPCLGLTERHWD
jgi:hypothetical protein